MKIAARANGKGKEEKERTGKKKVMKKAANFSLGKWCTADTVRNTGEGAGQKEWGSEMGRSFYDKNISSSI